jgi:sRNA-binding carbon storage regulator CsrA
MLVLSRQLGQGVSIDDQLVARVAVIGKSSVDLLVSDASGCRVSVVTLTRGVQSRITCDVTGVLIKIEPDKTRLGLSFPKYIRVSRVD